MRGIRTIPAVTAGALALAALAAAPAAAQTRELHDPYLPPPSQSDLVPPPAASAAPQAGAAASGPSVGTALARALRAGQITRAQHDAYRQVYRDARSARGRLSGGRGAMLASVLATADRIAAKNALSAARMPAVFLTLERNTDFMLRQPMPRSGARVVFEGSPVVFQLYPGQGLQIQMLANFGRANGLWQACGAAHRGEKGYVCDRVRYRATLDWLLALASTRGGHTAWEYFFPFGGGAAPWTSGLSQGTAIQALARGSKMLRERAYRRAAQRGLGVFEMAPPAGVRKRAGTGAHYLIYSFAPRLEVLNGFLQAVIGLHDYAAITGDARGRRLFEAGDRVARRQTPSYDTGSWSLYSRGGAASTVGYHRLVTGFLTNLCKRTEATVYCATADRFTAYLERRNISPKEPSGGGSKLIVAPDRGPTTVRLSTAGGKRQLVFRRSR